MKYEAENSCVRVAYDADLSYCIEIQINCQNGSHLVMSPSWAQWQHKVQGVQWPGKHGNVQGIST